MVKVNNIVNNCLITFVGKAEFFENPQCIFCPTKIGVAKSLVCNSCSLKYRNSFLCLIVLLTFTQGTIIVMNVSMNADLSTGLSDAGKKAGMAPEYRRGAEECRGGIVTTQRTNNGKLRFPCSKFGETKTRE